MNIVVIIPALNPTEKLFKIVDELHKNNLKDIIIVNDGSKKECVYIFKELKSKCKVVTHKVNKGKGASIKDAIKVVDKCYPNTKGFVTMDCDGQHRVKDVVKLASYLLVNDKIVLGVRDFKEKDVPFRSRFGNYISSLTFKLFTKVKCTDTQTGLRGIPISYKDLSLKIDGYAYEYEMNFLITIAKNKIKFKEIKIQTIYEDKNKCSHFKPLKDSIKIYKMFFKSHTINK